MKRRLLSSEQGMVSIIITMIIMSVLSLIVVGFAQLARREQREALDKQLSAQAFYAAESGINDALRAINDPSVTVNNKTTCDNTNTPFEDKDELNTDAGVAYSCLLIDTTPANLEYGSVELNQSTVVPINPVDTSTNPHAAVELNTLDISWNRENNEGSGGFYSNSTPGQEFAFPPASGPGSWGDDREAGILRVDLIPAAGPLSRDNLSNRMFTVFLYPQDGPANTATTVPYAANNGGQGGSIRKVNCHRNSTPRKCKASINGLPSDTQYYLRMTSIYSNSTVSISGTYMDASSVVRPVAFKDGQYVIDSTGKAGDVLKRVRVHKTAPNTDYRYPTYAINSVQDICKLLEVYPGGGSDGCTAP